MQFDIEKTGNFILVRVSGRLDATTATEFDAQSDSWLANDELQIVVDMGGVEYISSAGLRCILSAAKKLKNKGGELRFCGLNGMVADVFKISGFAAIFKLFDSVEQAIS